MPGIFEASRTYPLSTLGLDERAVDGPFLLPHGEWALLASLAGKHGGMMPSPGELVWQRALPPAARGKSVRLFLRRGREALCAGAMRPRTSGARVLFALDAPLEDATWRAFVDAASAPPEPAAEEAIACWTKATPLAVRLEGVRDFARRWYGPSVDVPAEPTALPVALRLLGAIDLAVGALTDATVESRAVESRAAEAPTGARTALETRSEAWIPWSSLPSS